ncbi:MAG TPA: restriction endonuclease [Gallionellaceae bacterium]
MSRQTTAEFVNWFGPLLDALRDLGDSGKPREVSNRIAINLNLSDEILDKTLKSGGSRFHNQVAWARQYLVWEGLIDDSRYGTWKLTERGRKTFLTPDEARSIFLNRVAINQANRKSRELPLVSEKALAEITNEVSPENSESSDSPSLIDVLRGLSPEGFEKICRELLRESGFENVEVTGRGADDGIDGFGTLEVNPFVTFRVLFQCKRYREGNAVSRAQVGDFRNAMIGRAEKGIMMTTSTFTNAAIQEASREGAPKIELVDGVKLVQMFERVELGLKKRIVYDVDLSFFEKYRS